MDEYARTVLYWVKRREAILHTIDQTGDEVSRLPWAWPTFFGPEDMLTNDGLGA